MIRTLRRVSGILPLTRWLTDTPSSVAIFIILGLSIMVAVDDTVHILALAIAHFFIDAEARPATRTATLALIVSG